MNAHIFYLFFVGVLSWIIGLKSIQCDCRAVPVALAAVVNNEAHKHETQGDHHPDLSVALRGDQLGLGSSRTLRTNIQSIILIRQVDFYVKTSPSVHVTYKVFPTNKL